MNISCISLVVVVVLLLVLVCPDCLAACPTTVLFPPSTARHQGAAPVSLADQMSSTVDSRKVHVFKEHDGHYGVHLPRATIWKRGMVLEKENAPSVSVENA